MVYRGSESACTRLEPLATCVQPDTGARYRIRSQGGAFLRKRSTAIGVSSHFFTLFDVRPLSQSPQHVLQAHGAAGWVARGGAREALVEVGTKNATAMQRFWLRALHGGGWSLDLDAEGTSYLCAAGASGQQERPVVPRLVIVGVAGTAPAAPGAVPTACARPPARAGAVRLRTFELQRVVAPYSSDRQLPRRRRRQQLRGGGARQCGGARGPARRARDVQPRDARLGRDLLGVACRPSIAICSCSTSTASRATLHRCSRRMGLRSRG